MLRATQRLLLLSLTFLALGGARAAAPNVVILLADDQGWGDMSLHGNDRVETPNIDGLFRESLQLKNFMVCPVCSPTRAGLLTGRHSLRLGAGPNVGGELDVAETTLGDFFQELGYRTGVFGKWHNGMEPDTPEFRAAFDKTFGHLPQKPYVTGFGANAHGFDRATVYYGGGPDKWTRKSYGNKLVSWFHDREYRPDEEGYLADLIVKHAVEFIKERGAQGKNQGKDKPFFCYVPFDLVHTPLQARPDLLARVKNRFKNPKHRLHSAMLLALDESVGAILKALDDAELREDTIVWYFSDNGGLGVGSSLPFRGGKGTLWEGGIHVPAAIHWPAGGFNGGEYAGLLGHLDVLPTLAGLLGKPLKTARPLDGVDCSNALRTRGPSPVHDGYWAWMDSDVVRTGDWKLFHFLNRVELYNMRTDQEEKHNVAEANPEVVREMSTRLAHWRKELGVASPLAPPDRNPKPKPEGDVLVISAEQTHPAALKDALQVQFAFHRHNVGLGDEMEFDIMIPEGDFLRKGFIVSPYRNGDPPVFNGRMGIDQFGRVQATGEGPPVVPGRWERRVVGFGHEAPLLRSYHGVFFHGEAAGRFRVCIDNVRIRRGNGELIDIWRDGKDTATFNLQAPWGFTNVEIKSVPLGELNH